MLTEKAVEILVEAELDGVPQLKYKQADGRGGYCAMGALFYRGRLLHEKARALEDLFVPACDWLTTYPCPHACGFHSYPQAVVVHMNNEHGDSFLTIARKLG